jgi:hypothetical protein
MCDGDGEDERGWPCRQDNLIVGLTLLHLQYSAHLFPHLFPQTHSTTASHLFCF